jgi:hypothetical protein
MLFAIESNQREIEVPKVHSLIFLIMMRIIGMLYLIRLYLLMVQNLVEEELIIFRENLFIGLMTIDQELF